MMQRPVSVLLAILLALTPGIVANATIALTGAGGFKGVAGGGGGGYVGPCDTSVAGGGGCSVYYGLRAANAAKATALAALFDWTCTNGSVFSGTLHSDSAGDANATELATIASDCGAQNVFATTIYEQLAGAANAPAVSGGLRFFNDSTTCKGMPRCFYAGGTFNGFNKVTGTVSISQQWTVASAACIVSTNANLWIAAKGSVWAVGLASSGNAGLYAGTGVVTATMSNCTSSANPHAIQYIGNGASSSIVVDGTATTGLAAGSNAIANNFGIGGDDSSFSWDGPISEVAFYPIGLAAGSSAGQYGAVCHNQRLYWGTGGTC